MRPSTVELAGVMAKLNCSCLLQANQS